MTVWVQRVLGFEMTAFLVSLLAVVLFQVLTGRIRLRGLLREKDGSRRLSWTRIQLLIATLITAGYTGLLTLTASPGRFPRVSMFWVVLMGASSALYLARKAYGRPFVNSQ